jgi:hypothetical protein
MKAVFRAERPGPTPTIARPDLDRDQDVKPKGLRPHKVVVLDWSTVCSTASVHSAASEHDV